MGFRKFGTGPDQSIEPEPQQELRVTAAQAEWTVEDENELHEENQRADGSSAPSGE